MMSKKEAALLSKYRKECRDLKKRLNSLNEVLTPFVFHGMALRALERDDGLTPVSEIGVSGLCIGAFRHLLEEVDPKEFRMIKR